MSIIVLNNRQTKKRLAIRIKDILAVAEDENGLANICWEDQSCDYCQTEAEQTFDEVISIWMDCLNDY